jgi:rod shape-determining protein MreD
MAMQRESIARLVPVSLLAVLLGMLIDTVIGPIVLRRVVTLHCTAAFVVLAGMRHGPWRGMLAGWFGGLLLAAVSTESLGMAPFSLGVAGYLAGHTQRMVGAGLVALDAFVLCGLLVCEESVAAILAWVALGVVPGFTGGGIIVTSLGMVCVLWAFPVRSSAPSIEQPAQGRSARPGRFPRSTPTRQREAWARTPRGIGRGGGVSS